MNTQHPTPATVIEESIKRLNDATIIKQHNQKASEFLTYLQSLKQQYSNENK